MEEEISKLDPNQMLWRAPSTNKRPPQPHSGQKIKNSKYDINDLKQTDS
jgi:hypothetical protein